MQKSEERIAENQGNPYDDRLSAAVLISFLLLKVRRFFQLRVKY